MMTALAVSPLIFWFAALVSRPRKPLPGNEIEEFVYSRLLGRQQSLVLLALVATVAAVVGMIAIQPQQVDPDLRAIRGANAACREARQRAAMALDYGSTTYAYCYERVPGGEWNLKIEQADGSWRIIGTVPAPLPYDNQSTILTRPERRQ